MWFDEAVFYQIYPLGLCGAPEYNDGRCESRILQILDWIPHFKRLGVDCVFFNPLFESDKHGYDTRDYRRLDCRLGRNEDLQTVCDALHEAGLKIMFDGVFNHVGRGFWAFQDVLQKRRDSAYSDWFKIDFNGSSRFHDGFWYKSWEGHDELVELNLRNPDLLAHLSEVIGGWIDELGVDALRLDVAYTLDKEFMARLRSFCLGKKADFFLLGEMIHGDYRQIVNERMLHSATNYGCYKSLYSAFNSRNLFEIGHSIQRQSGSESWALYRGLNLMNFVDNHDVERFASILQNPEQLAAAYTLMFGMPGIPCLYYGSEWGIRGLKRDGDLALRPALNKPEWNELSDHIKACIDAHHRSKALMYGDYKTILLTNEQFIFQRQFENERVLVAINAAAQPYRAHFDAGCGLAQDLLTGQTHDFGGGSELAAYSGAVWLMER